jgi:urease accessory protein
MQLRYLLSSLLAPIALLVSPLVLAHSGAGHAAGLADGFMHPVTGLDHLAIAIAAGFWAGRSGDHGVPDVGYFLSLFLGGMLLGIGCIQFPELQLSTVMVVGLTVAFIALTIATPQHFSYIFFGGFAIYHGIVHMLEMPSPAAATGYIIGLFFATGLMLMLGLILRQVVVTRKPHSQTTS